MIFLEKLGPKSKTNVWWKIKNGVNNWCKVRVSLQISQWGLVADSIDASLLFRDPLRLAFSLSFKQSLGELALKCAARTPINEMKPLHYCTLLFTIRNTTTRREGWVIHNKLGHSKRMVHRSSCAARDSASLYYAILYITHLTTIFYTLNSTIHCNMLLLFTFHYGDLPSK